MSTAPAVTLLVMSVFATRLPVEASRRFGDSFSLEYERAGNRVGMSNGEHPTPVDMPKSQWTLSRVVRSDGFGHAHGERFAYFASGYYDRREREDYGFAHVRATREADDARTDTWFHNRDYYRRGRPWLTASYDGTGHLLRASRTTWTAPPSTLPLREGSFFSATTLEQSFVYDGSATDVETAVARLSTQQELTHDALGNGTQRIDRGDVGAALTYVVHIKHDATRWISRPEWIEVRSSTGAVLRRVEATYWPGGRLHTITEVVRGGRRPGATGGTYAGTTSDRSTSTFDYDAYGNVSHTLDPAGLELTYTYDPLTRTHPVGIVDSFGLSSQATYDLRFGAPLTITDTNGAQQVFAYDDFGRLTSLRGPYDVGAAEATVTYEYALQPDTSVTFPLWGRTRNKDSAHAGDPIDTVVFIDGFGRTVQTKVDAEIDNGPGTTSTTVGMAVSGAIHFDALGRVDRMGQGSFDTGPWSAMVAVPETYPTVTTYDPQGRVQEVTFADGTNATSSYGFESIDGVEHELTTHTDPLGRERRTLTDVLGRTREVRLRNTIDGAFQTLTTRYEHDLLGRLSRVTDAAGHQTLAVYDSRGLLVSLDNPDTGRVEYRYSLAGTVRREGVRCVEAPEGQTSSSSRLRPGRRNGFERSQFASICWRRIWCQGRVSPRVGARQPSKPGLRSRAMAQQHDSDHPPADHGCDHDCHNCGAAPIQTLAACPFCRTAYPDVEPGVVCPGCGGVSLKGRTVCGACNGSLTRACVFCAAASLLDLPACARCHEPFDGAEERKRARLAGGALPKNDPTGAGIFNTLDAILKR